MHSREAAGWRQRWPRIQDHLNVGTFAFVVLHLACLPLFWRWRMATRTDLALGATVYLAQAFGISAGYHRYFSHRSFRTSRPMQFFLAFLGTLSAQRGVLWWVQHHRHHHRYSDTPEDLHSPMY